MILRMRMAMWSHATDEGWIMTIRGFFDGGLKKCIYNGLHKEEPANQAFLAFLVSAHEFLMLRPASQELARIDRLIRNNLAAD